MEVWTEKDPLIFDGTVLEAFTRDGDRWHIAHLESVRLEPGKKGLQLLRIDAGRYGGLVGWIVPEANIPAVHQLVQAINEARAQQYGLPPMAP